MRCPVCDRGQGTHHADVDGVAYFKCGECGSLFADPAFLRDVDEGRQTNYRDDYWQEEVSAARERSFGSSLHRVAEVFFYCRVPIERFVDIGSGPGLLLDALSRLMPASRDMFHGVELFPPPPPFRTTHPNYHLCALGDLPLTFQAGCCVEVIEHLTPAMLDGLITQLAARADPGATFYFGSAQPSFVEAVDPGYLDPHRRGHVVSYSLKALGPRFARHGLNLIPLPGRDWAFLAEKSAPATVTTDELLSRLWTALPENITRLKDPEFGPMMHVAGLESARCYLEAARVEERTHWAQSLLRQVRSGAGKWRSSG